MPKRIFASEHFASGRVDCVGNRNDFLPASLQARVALHRAESKVSAIIVAAGSGVRLGSGGPKAFVKIGGRTMLWYSLDAIRQIASIGEVVIAVPGGIRKCGARRGRGCRARRSGQDYGGRRRASGFSSNRAGADQFRKRTGYSARRGASSCYAADFRIMHRGGGASGRCDRGDTGRRHLEARRGQLDHCDCRTRRAMAGSNTAGVSPRRSSLRRIDAQSMRESSRPTTRIWSNGPEFASKWSKAQPPTSRSPPHQIWRSSRQSSPLGWRDNARPTPSPARIRPARSVRASVRYPNPSSSDSHSRRSSSPH